MKKLNIFLLFSLFTFSSNILAQELQINESYAIDISQLPEYVVIRTSGKFILININIESKKSKYAIALEALENLLDNKQKVDVSNLTDLLNVMSNIGFEYVDGVSMGEGDIANIVFRKKIEYRK